MVEPNVAPYGSWKSPITSDLIVAGTIGLGQVLLDGEDIYWIESRPTEGGRSALVKRANDGQTDLTPLPFNVRTRVHEYGGGAFLVKAGTAYFSNFADQRIYCRTAEADVQPLTPETGWRYADYLLDSQRDRLICVREDHSVSAPEPENVLVSVPLQAGTEQQVLASGSSFYASPRLSPDGTHLAWIAWNHPNMPWDGTELWVAEIQADGSLGSAQQVAGGIEESIFQPEWSPDGVLHFVSDRTGWWNLYRWPNQQIEPLCPMEAEFGLPQWVFGMTTYGFAANQQIICTYSKQGIHYLASLNTVSGELTPFNIPYSRIDGVKVATNQVVLIAGSATLTTSIVQLDLATGTWQVLRRASDLEIDPGYLSIPTAIEFPTEHGLTAHGFFYPPKNRDFVAPSGERPPLLVKSHGGPTSATAIAFNLGIQYWTSRGVAVLDVNYGGSTGYGRPYRERLKNQWGIVDVDDCANGAKYLADQDKVDGDRLVISGGSAGGYTTLCALTFRDTFKAGASYYGISDLEALARDTHKFEARYLDSLVGPYPERQDLYIARSPIHFTEQLACPVIFFQGLEDRVVPPNQAEIMVEAIKSKGLPVAYVPFAGEQHGFRRAENIKRALDGEFYFYSRIFGFEMAETVEPIAIANLDE